MPFDELPATLRFLTDAGHLLASASPETSAFLLRQRDGLMFEHELAQPETQRQHVCSCCGHILALGRGSTLSFKREKVIKGRKVTEPRHGPTKAITCGHCGKMTKIKLPAPAPISKRHVKVAKPSETPTGTASSFPVPAEDSPQKPSNASSKKRAKSRKAGLQALLDQSKAAKGSGGLGLSLSDFMQR